MKRGEEVGRWENDGEEMIGDLYSLSVIIVYAAIGALVRALFGIYKAYKTTVKLGEFRINWRRILFEVCVSIIIGTFGVVLINGMNMDFGFALKITAMIGGLLGADVLTYITKKFGITKELDIRVTDEEVALAAFNPRQINALVYFRSHKSITNSIYQRLNHTTHSIAAKDLAQMVRMKKLKKSGTGKSTYYFLV